jgi:DNA-binding response OmpR family regulator
VTTRALRVLVADADLAARESIRDRLVASGLACELAASAEEALKAAEHPSVGLVLLDVRLPGASDVSVLEAIVRRRPALRVIALAGADDQALVLDALRAGASDYLAKPVHAEELPLAVRRGLRSYGVESRWQSLRMRLHQLSARLPELETLSHADDPGHLHRLIAEAMAELLAATRVSLMLADASGSVLRVIASVGNELEPEDMEPAKVGESVAGLALEEGHALLIDDVETDPRSAARPRRPRYASSSVALAPLVGPQGPLGVICATDRHALAPFEDEDLALLRIFAGQASAALARSQGGDDLLEPEQTGEGDLCAELAREICEAVAAEIEPERLLGAALRSVGRALSTRVVSLHLVSGAMGALRREAQWEDTSSDRDALPRDRGLTGAVLQTGALVATDHPEADPRFDAEVDTPAEGEVGPLIVAPLRLRGKVVGVVRAFPPAADGARARVGETLTAALSAAIRNVLLYRSLVESIDDVARARRDAGPGYG